MILRRRTPRLKGLSINHLLPNVLTVLALCAGLTGIRFAMQGQWRYAVTSIIVAAILDGLDGRLARLLGGGSKFGAELDSLSDFFSFGVAPAVMIYLWSMGSIEGPGWAAVMFYSTCAALRLARFNTKIGDPDMPPWAYNYFTGVPAPAGAGIAMLPMIISFEWPEGPFTIATLNAVWLVAVGLLMVSRIPTFAFKKAKVPHKYVLPTLVGMGLLTAALVSSPWLTIAAFGVLYLACIPFSYRSYRALTLEAQRIAGKVEEIPPPAT